MNTTVSNLRKLKYQADWKLLLFLLLFLNVKLAVKIPAILLIYLLQFNFRFGFKLRNSRLPLFYLWVIPIALADFILNKSYTNPDYLIVLSTGIGFWLLCILAVHQIKLAVERNEAAVIHRTILIFFLLNAVISILSLVFIMWKTGTLNPYTYQGQYQKYFINTGDYIRGITFDTSVTNAVLNAFGVLYFLIKKEWTMLLVCLVVLLLAGSNFINITLFLILILLFVFRSSRNQKSIIVVCLALLMVFLTKISPQNNRYVTGAFRHIFHQEKISKPQLPLAEIRITDRSDSSLNPEERKQKTATLYLDSLNRVLILKEAKGPSQQVVNKLIVENDHGRILVPAADINSAPYQSIKVPVRSQQPILQFIEAHKSLLPFSGSLVSVPGALPGKLIGLLQTGKYMLQNRGKILMGDGTGNFSSKLAFRATGLGFAGGFPHQYTYINHDFMRNHLDLYLYFFSKEAGYHSLTNSPFSVYDQMFAEYGILGFLAFIIYYLGFFGKHYKKLTYGLPVLLLMTAAFFSDYWFEQLSVVLFFELILLLDIKESTIAEGGAEHG